MIAARCLLRSIQAKPSIVLSIKRLISTSPYAFTQSTIGDVANEITQKSPALTREQRSGSLTCYNCGQVGHAKVDCPTIMCNTCNEMGHMTRNCPSVVCFVCNETGHVANKCPQDKPRCHYCGELGHMQFNCPSKAQ